MVALYAIALAVIVALLVVLIPPKRDPLSKEWYGDIVFCVCFGIIPAFGMVTCTVHTLEDRGKAASDFIKYKERPELFMKYCEDRQARCLNWDVQIEEEQRDQER